MNRERGSALIIVILVILVLTMVGLAGILYMSVESKISGNDILQKEALYAAEAGLRVGERVLSFVRVADLSTLITRTSTLSTPGVSPQVPQMPAPYDINHLGTYLTQNGINGGPELAYQELDYTTRGNRAFFSLYIRNNSTDPAGPLIDGDARVHLISVGWLEDGNGTVLMTKIVAEELASGVLSDPGTQKLGDAGGTSSGTIE